MNKPGAMAGVGREDVANHIMEKLRSLTEDVDIDTITLQTCMGDTGLDSVCVAYLIGDIQQKYELGDAVYRALVPGVSPILTLQVSEIVDCVCECLVQSSPAERES
jgi:hypothetical protein